MVKLTFTVTNLHQPLKAEMKLKLIFLNILRNLLPKPLPHAGNHMILSKNKEKISSVIEKSNYISRDLSWMQFNWRVLDQSRRTSRTIFERLKFLAITASNLDEFFMIRVGSLYNYLDYHKERIDYSGLRELPFKRLLFETAQQFYHEQQEHFKTHLQPLFAENHFRLVRWNDLTAEEKSDAEAYFMRTVFPMLTPMAYDNYHTFPILLNKVLSFGVVTCNGDDRENERQSFVQVPQNLPRFFEIHHNQDEYIAFLPLEEIIRSQIGKLYRNVEIISVSLFRIIRNGDFTIEENEDSEESFVDEIKEKLKTRRTGRVLRMEIEPNFSYSLKKALMTRFELDEANIFENDVLMDFTSLWQVVGHPEFRGKSPGTHPPVRPLFFQGSSKDNNLLEILKNEDILLHHPYNNFEPVLQLLEQAADDPDVLAIKMTLYRIAKHSRITNALLKAAENGKTVSVLFEVKARFDEERNIREAERLQKAGCYVVYGVSRFKTHTKLLLIVRQEEQGVTRYTHLSSGNYNEDTSRLYTDLGLLTTNEVYGHDVSEFFNVITGHSEPPQYQNLLTAPRDLRNSLVALIRQEARNAKDGLPCGILLKVNSLEDKTVIDELYLASQEGVPVRLVIRGMCCLRPHRQGLSDNISVRSVVGDFLEHTRIYYFHNGGNPKVYGGSADIMVRSFDKRIESLFQLVDDKVRQQAIHILACNLKDNVNAYEMQEDGSYTKVEPTADETPFNIHKAFFLTTEAEVMQAKVF